jgi:integrase/recombinase XerD
MKGFMLEDYYVKPSTVDRVRGSWLAPQIESYLRWLEAHGYFRLVGYRQLPLLFHFAEFARKKGCRDVVSCKAYIKEFVSQRLEQHGAKAKTAVAVRSVLSLSPFRLVSSRCRSSEDGMRRH